MQRVIAAILAVPNIANGLMMLVAGPLWYQSVPGATETGPFNPHFVKDIGAAFLVSGVALDRLSPQERAAFLLHDVFEVPFSEIATMIGRSEPACRQLATRARRAVRDERPVPATSPDSHERLLKAFLEAVASSDISQLTGLLREDAVAVTDGGGRKSAALNPIHGADKIARFFIGVAGKNANRDIHIEPAVINGSAGALLYLDGELDHTLSVSIDGGRIAAIYLVRNPDKLRHAPAQRTRYANG